MENIVDEPDGLVRGVHDGPCLYPLGELVDSDQNVCVATRCFFEGSDQIKSPYYERPGDGNSLERLRGQVGLPCIILAPLACSHHLICFGHYSRPVDSPPGSVPHKDSWSGMVPAGTAVDVLQELSSLLDWDATLLYSSVSLFVQLSSD